MLILSSRVVIKQAITEDKSIIKEAADRFGYDKLVLEVEDYKLIYDKEFVDGMKEIGISALLLKHVK